MESKILFEKIDKMREEQHMSVYKICKEAAVSRTVYTKWKDGETFPSLSSLEGFCDALGTSVVALLMEEEGVLSEERENNKNIKRFVGLNSEVQELCLDLSDVILKFINKEK